MNKAGQAVIEFLKGSKDAWKPGRTTFPEIDVSQLGKDMCLELKGAARAQKGTIALDDEGRDATEREIIEEIKRRARLARSDYTAAIELYDSRLREAAIGQEAFVQIEAVGEEGLGNFKAQTIEDRVFLEFSTEKAKQTFSQYQMFVQRNHLAHVAPITPSSKDLVNGWAWVATIVMIESLLNGMFFAQGSELGLIGGFAEAIMLSILNIGFATLIAVVGLRYIQHRSTLRKLAGIAVLIILIPILICLNLLIAHYREAFAGSAGSQVDFEIVRQSFLNRTWELRDTRSWLLGIVGLFMSLIAVYKLYTLYDPYPGYGEIATRKDKALQTLQQDRTACIDFLTTHRAEAIEQMQEIITLVGQRRHEFELALRSRERLHKQFKEYVQGLEGSAKSLLFMYRNFFDATDLAESVVRGVALDPPPPLETSFLTDAQSHERAVETMSQYIQKIAAEYEKAVNMVDEIWRPARSA